MMFILINQPKKEIKTDEINNIALLQEKVYQEKKDIA